MIFFFKQKTAYEMRISDWSSDVCSSDLILMPCEHPLWPAQPFAEDETMQRPLNIIDLAITEEVSQDAAEVARRLDKAADLVEDFAADAALNALDELVALAATPGAEIGRAHV